MGVIGGAVGALWGSGLCPMTPHIWVTTMACAP